LRYIYSLKDNINALSTEGLGKTMENPEKVRRKGERRIKGGISQSETAALI
jgi:hypothetical protein